MTIQTPISDKGPNKLRRFTERFEPLYGDGHFIFAMHAAFPVLFTPDLLYKIWINFSVYRKQSGQLATIHPVAVSDLLLSEMCSEVGYEQYELHRETRSFLLSAMEQNQQFGKTRLKELAGFLLQYAAVNNSQDQHLKDVHQWTAQSVLSPVVAAESIGKAFATAISDNQPGEQMRLYSLLNNIGAQAGEFKDLLSYGEGIREHLYGNTAHVIQVPVLTFEPQENGPVLLELPVPESLQGNIELIDTPGSATDKIIRKAINENATELDLRGYPELTEFPLTILSMTHLTILRIGGTRRKNSLINTLPDGIADLQALQFLDVSFNNLDTLPSTIGQLKQLRELHARGNHLKTLPPGTGTLTDLVTLDVSNNDIDRLPESLQDLTNLKYVGVADNPVASRLPIETFKQEPVTIIREIILLQNASEGHAGPAAHIKGYTYDIFLSHAALDNEKLFGQSHGWVENFFTDLNVLLSRRIGRSDALKIWWDNKALEEGIGFDTLISDAVENSAIFLCLSSPGYFQSNYCRQELTQFYQKARKEKIGLKAGEHSRIVNVMLSNIPRQEWPFELKDTAVLPFHDATSGEDAGDLLVPGSSEFRERLIDLRDVIIELIQAMQLASHQSNKSQTDNIETDTSIHENEGITEEIDAISRVIDKDENNTPPPGTKPGTDGTPAGAYLKGYAYDIFLSYTHLDNQKLYGERQGWIEHFYSDLNMLLSRRIGRSNAIKIWWDRDKLDGRILFNDSIAEGVKDSAIMLCLVSPGYLASEYCRRELELFRQRALDEPVGLKVGERSRIINVLLNNIPFNQWPKELAQTTGFPFNDGSEGDLGDLLVAGSPEYHARLQELGAAIEKLILEMERESNRTYMMAKASAPDDSLTIFFGDVSDNLRATRKRIISELEKTNVRIVYDVPPPFEANSHDIAVTEKLEAAGLSVHLLDQYPGREIEGELPMWYPQRQAELCLRSNIPQFIWIPAALDISQVEEANYKTFLENLQNGKLSSKKIEFVRGPKSEITSQVTVMVKQLSAKPAIREKELSALIDVHPVDQAYAMELSKILLENRIQPFINPAKDDAGLQLKTLQERINLASRLIFIYGKVSREWVLERMSAALQIIVTNNYPVEHFYVIMLPPHKDSNEIILTQRFVKVNVFNNSDFPRLQPALLSEFVKTLWA